MVKPTENLLEMKDFSGAISGTRVLSDISLDLPAGKISALVGESGSGKSLTALSLLGLCPLQVSGDIFFQGEVFRANDEEKFAGMRGRSITMVFQDALMSLNETFSIEKQIGAVLRRNNIPGAEARQRVLNLLNQVSLQPAETWAKAYPRQLSGGMRQRVMIAMALAAEPALLIADEPTTALDVTVQAEILKLLKGFNRQQGITMLLISHDIGVVSAVADVVNVMYGGTIVESGPVNQVLHEPAHPYTRALLNCRVSFDTRPEELAGIRGSVPAVGSFPSGCGFRDRCDLAEEKCAQKIETRGLSDGHWVKCVQV